MTLKNIKTTNNRQRQRQYNDNWYLKTDKKTNHFEFVLTNAFANTNSK